MKPAAKLHESGQSLWLDNISREMLDSGRLRRYIDEYSVTGPTSWRSRTSQPTEVEPNTPATAAA